MPVPAIATTRRAALGAALALVATSACDVDDLRPPEVREPEPTTPSASPAPGTDEALVAGAATAIMSALELAVLVRRRFPVLAPSAGPLVRAHRGHLGVLDLGGGLQTRTSTSVPSSAARALRQLRDDEQRLQQTLASAAVDARSGALARLFASMSASVAQHLALLPTEVPAGAAR